MVAQRAVRAFFFFCSVHHCGSPPADHVRPPLRIAAFALLAKGGRWARSQRLCSHGPRAASLVGHSLNTAIGLQVVAGALITGLAAVTQGRQVCANKNSLFARTMRFTDRRCEDEHHDERPRSAFDVHRDIPRTHARVERAGEEQERRKRL